MTIHGDAVLADAGLSVRGDDTDDVTRALAWHAEGLRVSPSAPSVLHVAALVAEIERLRERVRVLTPDVDQCTAARGHRGRCPNMATHEYQQTPWDGRPAYWLKRCADHPMRNKPVRPVIRRV